MQRQVRRGMDAELESAGDGSIFWERSRCLDETSRSDYHEDATEQGLFLNQIERLRKIYTHP